MEMGSITHSHRPLCEEMTSDTPRAAGQWQQVTRAGPSLAARRQPPVHALPHTAPVASAFFSVFSIDLDTARKEKRSIMLDMNVDIADFRPLYYFNA